MKLVVLLAAALLLVGCPGNTAQNAPTLSQGGSGRPETPGTPKDVSAAPRSAHLPVESTAPLMGAWSATAYGRHQAGEDGRSGAPRVLDQPGCRGSPRVTPEPIVLAGGHGGAPLFAHIGTAAGAIRGTARWFATGPNGVAAAGPRLRAALGSHWRGTLVGVTYRGRTIWLRVGDWCACGSGSIIDLPDEVFARFAPLSRGVLSVTVHWGDRNVLPATDAAP